jgi:hypothetical protein
VARRFTPAVFLRRNGEATGLFRTNRRIAAGASGRRYHLNTPTFRRGCVHSRIDSRGRIQDTIRSGQLVSERLVDLAGRPIVDLSCWELITCALRGRAEERSP